MRLRFNKHATDNLLENKQYFFDTKLVTNLNPTNLFSNHNKPVYLEIGSGKGNFIINNAIQFQEINFLGLEKYDTVLNKALNKLLRLEHPINNLKLISFDANKITTLFKKHSINRLYLNFSDPWPKARHEKRRLTHPDFLEQYKEILTTDAIIEFKTDNDGLFSWTLNEVILKNPSKYEVIYYTTDLYQELDKEINKNNIPTEYEIKFHNLNKNINKLVFRLL